MDEVRDEAEEPMYWMVSPHAYDGSDRLISSLRERLPSVDTHALTSPVSIDEQERWRAGRDAVIQDLADRRERRRLDLEYKQRLAAIAKKRASECIGITSAKCGPVATCDLCGAELRWVVSEEWVRHVDQCPDCGWCGKTLRSAVIAIRSAVGRTSTSADRFSKLVRWSLELLGEMPVARALHMPPQEVAAMARGSRPSVPCYARRRQILDILVTRLEYFRSRR